MLYMRDGIIHWFKYSRRGYFWIEQEEEEEKIKREFWDDIVPACRRYMLATPMLGAWIKRLVLGPGMIIFLFCLSWFGYGYVAAVECFVVIDWSIFTMTIDAIKAGIVDYYSNIAKILYPIFCSYLNSFVNEIDFVYNTSGSFYRFLL